MFIHMVFFVCYIYSPTTCCQVSHFLAQYEFYLCHYRTYIQLPLAFFIYARLDRCTIARYSPHSIIRVVALVF